MRASDSSLKISSNADLAALQLEYADSTSDPNSPNFDPNADPEEVAAQQQIKLNQQFNDDLKTNNKDTQPNSGPIQAGNKPGQASHGANQVVHALANDSVSHGSESHQRSALSSIQSHNLDAPTQRVAGLQNLSVRDLDHTQRA
jgi:hypothetical protein